MKILIACFLFSIAKAHISTFHIPVLENANIFNQMIRTNLIDDVVEFHTPAHNEILETFKIQDFKQGLQAFCMPAKHECFVSHLNKSHYPNAGHMMEGFAHVWNNGLNWMTSKNTQTIQQRWIKTHSAIPNTSTHINKFLALHGFPVYKLEKIPDDAVLLKDVSHRRDLIDADKQCAPGIRPIRRYGYTKTGGCDWLYFCPTSTETSRTQVKTNIGCENKHITDQIFYSCLCCPGVQLKHNCLFCDEI
ncbi:uncharacterized protein LOC134256571 [Saccostrea cucullata]|uniref:uncharacterized protein LOC134256571 n=1 Tax=Saccostrea cuccullata TaxID=36930 RepID=UPI002ED6B9A1